MREVFSLDLLKQLSEVNHWYAFLPLIIGVFRFRRLSRIQLLIFYVVVLTVVNDSLGYYLEKADIPNIWSFHLYVPLLFFLMLRVYRKELSLIIPAKVFGILLILFLLGSITTVVINQDLSQWPAVMIFCSSALYMALVVIYFYSLLKYQTSLSLESRPLFWFSAGVLIYNSTTFLLFLFVLNILEGSMPVINVGFGMNAIFNLVLLTSYSISLWLKPRHQ